MSDNQPFASGVAQAVTAALASTESGLTLKDAGRFWAAQAVLLHRGGSDWFWMTALRNGFESNARVGALVLIEGAVAYAEVVKVDRPTLKERA